MLEGLPTTDQTIEHARKRAKELFGERATMLVPPATTPVEGPPERFLKGLPPNHRLRRPRERCPEWTVIAWLNAPAMNKTNDGSELVVIWFQDAISYEIPGELLHDFGCGTWEKHAADWQI